MSKHSSKSAATKAPTKANVTPFPKPRPRLDGDELFAWATMHAELRHQHEKINASGFVFLQNRKLNPEQYLLDEQGFIIPRKEYEAGLRQASSTSTAPTHQAEEPERESADEQVDE